MHQTKPLTHVLWLQKWEGGRFRKWLQVGKGRIEIDADGTATVHNFQDLTAIGGWSGYTCLLPIGVKPNDPEPIPKRPASPSGDVEEG
jgi:hypothetical protein